mmetsp:Transcript_5070/g.8307  ORF Transcript_5070/g.8307 Transcript_5070/m.8307 type:complete len:384 (+) Transcript_5070:68-1219(+)
MTVAASSLTPQQILQAYDAQIDERRSERDQLKEVRACMKTSHEVIVTNQLAYLEHLTRKLKSRLQRGGDISTYSRAMEGCYKNQQQNQQQRPVNDVIRRQSMLLRVTHHYEVQRNSIALACHQNKGIIIEGLRKDISDVEEEKAQVQSTYSQRREERLVDMERSKQQILTSTIQPQRMVLKHLKTLLLLNDENADNGRNDLEEQMMQRRRRQTKGIQATLKERSESFKKMRQQSFERAKQHRRKSFGSSGGDLGADESDYLDCGDDKSIGSNKSGWSHKSGWSAGAQSCSGPGWSVKSGKSGKSPTSTRRGILGRLFGRSSSTTLESETAPSPALMEISVTKLVASPTPRSSAFLFMTGLDDELDPDFPTELNIGMTESSVES